MPRRDHKEQTQETPKEKYEIPIPKRGDVFRVFKQATKPEKELSSKRGPKKKGLK
jgi:hypothetical protein